MWILLFLFVQNSLFVDVIKALKEKWNVPHIILRWNGIMIQNNQTPMDLKLKNGDKIASLFPWVERYFEEKYV